MKKDGSNLTIKDELLYGNCNMSKRPLSAVNKRPHSCTTKKLPSVSNTTVDIQPTTNPKPFGHIIEKEKLFEETLQLKRVIQRLKKELMLINNENKIKDYQLTVKDYEIKEIIEESETPEYCPTVQDTNLIAKIRNQYRVLRKEYEEEVEQGEVLKQQYKFTKISELNMENELLKQQIEKINALYQNSYQINEMNTRKLNDYAKVVDNIQNQNVILASLKESLINSMAKEQSMSNEIEELKAKCKKCAEVINKTNEDNEMLYKQNDSLANANYSYNNNNNKGDTNSHNSSLKSKRPSSGSGYLARETKETYTSKISDLETQIKYHKSQNARYTKQFSQMNIKKSNLERQKEINKEDIMIDYKVIQNKEDKSNKLSQEELLKQLKATLEDSKKKENELEMQLTIYQEKVRNLVSSTNILNDQAGFGLSKDNPFYTEEEDNNPLESKKMTTIQYNQFTYILFKNFEAKKINKEIANEKIIKPTIQGDINDITLEVIVTRMSNAMLSLLHCTNEKDKERLEIYLTALFYNFDGDINKIVDAFLILFAYIEDYSNGKEDKIKAKLASKHKDKYDQLKDNIASSHSSDEKYISLLKIKEIIDEKNINIKDKYIEYIFYKMKQFDDEKASLFDLEIKKLEEMFELSTSHLNDIEHDNDNDNETEEKHLNEKEKDLDHDHNNDNDHDNENENNESVQEITTAEYEKIIENSLTRIHKALKENKISFADLIKDSVVNLKNSQEVISIEDLNIALKKINVHLEDLSLSCLCTKYCNDENEERMLSVTEMEKDLKKISIEYQEEEGKISKDSKAKDKLHDDDAEEEEDEDGDGDYKEDNKGNDDKSNKKEVNDDVYEFEDKEEVINKTQ